VDGAELDTRAEGECSVQETLNSNAGVSWEKNSGKTKPLKHYRKKIQKKKTESRNLYNHEHPSGKGQRSHGGKRETKGIHERAGITKENSAFKKLKR